MSKVQINIRASNLTRNQLDELSQRLGMNQTELISIAIDRMYRNERKDKMTAKMNDNEIYDMYVAPGAYEDGLRRMSIKRIASDLRDLDHELDDETATEYAEAIKRVLANSKLK